jgi:hypothetical protein
MQAPIDAAIEAVGDLFVFQNFHKFFAGDSFFVVEIAGKFVQFIRLIF